jgi:hypothetical protein
MFLESRRLIVLSCAIVPALLLGSHLPAAERASGDPVTLFEDRVAAYVALHRQCAARLLVRGVEPDSSGEATFREALGGSIRFARRHAQAGDILCPSLAARILQLVRTDLAARERLERQAILDGVPQRQVRVNDCYPSGEPLATMPPALLLRLPPLAPELQYRFIGRMLILLDVDASLVVDVLPDALPRHP